MTDNQIKEYLNKIEVITKLDQLIDKYKIAKKKEDIIKQILFDYFSGKIKEDDLDLEIQEKADLNFNLVLDFTYDLENELFPLLPANLKKPEGKTESVEAKLEDILKEIKKQAKLKIEERYEKRFEDSVYNWFRDIRDDSETEDVLTKSAKIGGLGLNSDQANNLINILKNIETDYKSKGVNIRDLISKELKKEQEVFQEKKVKEENIDVDAKVKMPEKTEEKSTGEDVTIDQLLKDKGVAFSELSDKEEIKKKLENKEEIQDSGSLEQKIENKEKFLESREELNPPPPVLAAKKEEEMPQKKEAIKSNESISTFKSSPAPTVTNPSPVIPKTPKIEEKQPLFKKTFSESRPKIEDVKFSTKLYGPIDELAAFKIEDLRRLAKDPKEAINKIKDKLDLLEDESIVKRTEGIKALKTSPLYKSYADIMNKAMKEGMSFEQVLKQNPTMTIEEFRSIMELNKSLKY